MENDYSSSIVHHDETLEPMADDDQEEWEYEYSATETETYYLTLELSYPEFKGLSAKANAHSRAGYYKNWKSSLAGAETTPSHPTGRNADPGTGAAGDARAREQENSSSDEAGAGAGAGSGFDAVADAPVQGDDTNPTALIDPALRAKGKQPMRANDDLTTEDDTPRLLPSRGPLPISVSDKASDVRDEIQILELHSDHPIISYRGRLFEGEWAEIIGTEMLLARHDSQKPLPSLRQVPVDIDMLAAVSSRIVTKEKTLVASARHPGQSQDSRLAATRQEWNIQIPATGKGRSSERQQQARFLENLIALKKIKGQTDNVTVYAADGPGKDFDDTKDPDYKPRRKRLLPNPEADVATPADST